tara:strand:- start:1972 stop:2256 length:285 start_codon:yes stop_codon:yes gene_type:complete
VYGYKVKRIIGIGDKKNTKSQINQQVTKNIKELKIRNRNKNLLEALPDGIGLVEVLGFFKSISASIILLRSMPIVLADTAAIKIRIMSFIMISS